MVPWLGIALLSASWLFGLSYYQPANYWIWGVLVVAGIACSSAVMSRDVDRRIAAIAAACLVAGLFIGWMPFDRLPSAPALAACSALFAGLLILSAPRVEAIVPRIGNSLLAAGITMLAQLCAISFYESQTSRSHDLPGALAHSVGAAARLLSLDSGVFESNVSLHSMREVHKLGATWELLVDPVSLCFFVGGCVAIALAAWSSVPVTERGPFFAKRIGVLSLVMAIWLPMRAGLLIAAYMHLGLRLDYEADPDAMILFWQPWLHGILLLPPVLACWRFVAWPDVREAIRVAAIAPHHRPSWQLAAALGLTALASLCAAFGLWWDPVGTRNPGRVLIDELHIGKNPRTQREMHWEPTIRPYDTEWYGQDSSYNYYCLYEYLEHYYDIQRLEHPDRDGARKRRSLTSARITNALLRDFDVLVLKVPTLDYEPAEIEAIKRFVERGGGLLLIGEHTDVFGTGRHLNSVAREFGFSFRHDCLFGIDSVFDQAYQPPSTPHPIVQHLPRLDFATSGSIDPGDSRGRAAIRSTGLWSLPADYHADNYYPQVEWRSDMRYGAFVQLWTARQGDGRVAAFADSTILSNFSAFQPGKAELMLGMVEWLNHSDSTGDPRLVLFMLAGALGIAAIWLARVQPDGWVAILAVAVGTFAASSLVVRTVHATQMPPPKTDESKINRVYFDQEVSNARLPDGSFIDGKRDGFGIFERWVLRLGYFLKRPEPGESLASADLLVVTYPRQQPSAAYVERLKRYVSEGGKLLVIDSADNRGELDPTAEGPPPNAGSTANALLEAFGISIDEESSLSGTLTSDQLTRDVPIEKAVTVSGGEPLFAINEKTVAAWTQHGNGAVYAIGFGTRFSDLNMGVTGDTMPDAAMRTVYDLEYSLLRWIVEGRETPKSD